MYVELLNTEEQGEAKKGGNDGVDLIQRKDLNLWENKEPEEHINQEVQIRINNVIIEIGNVILNKYVNIYIHILFRN